MSKKKTKAENPEAVQQTQPAYVQQLLQRGAVVLTGRSQGELDEKLAAIPSDINYYTGTVDHYLGTGLYRVQVNLKEK
jgi:hypothetical protein